MIKGSSDYLLAIIVYKKNLPNICRKYMYIHTYVDLILKANKFFGKSNYVNTLNPKWLFYLDLNKMNPTWLQMCQRLEIIFLREIQFQPMEYLMFLGFE